MALIAGKHSTSRAVMISEHWSGSLYILKCQRVRDHRKDLTCENGGMR